MFNPPPGFHEANSHFDGAAIKSQVMSSAISVADLERQLVYVLLIYYLLIYYLFSRNVCIY